MELVLAAHVLGDLVQHAIAVRLDGVGVGAEHALRRGVVRRELLLPVRQLRPRRRLEEGLLGHRQRVGVDERAAADADAVEDGHVLEEGHLEEALQAELGHPHPALEIPVGVREVRGGKALPLLEDEHLVALLREPQRRDAAAEAGADDDEVVVVVRHGRSRENQLKDSCAMISISQARQVLRRTHALRGRLAPAQRRRRATASSAPTARARPRFLRDPRRRRAGDRGQRQRSPPTARVGVLRQDRFLDDEQIILDVAMMGDAEVWDALQERARIVDHGDGDPGRLAELEDTLAHSTATRSRRAPPPSSRASASRIALAPPAALDALGRLQAARAARRRCSSAGPTCCSSTSRPTTSTSSRSAGSRSSSPATAACALVISHDQRFLDNVATHILDVDYGTITALHRQLRGLRAARRRPCATRKEAEIARAEKIIAAQARLRRALRRQGDQGQAGAEPAQADREDRGRGARGELAARAAVPLRARAAERRDVLEVDGLSQGVRRQAGAARRVAHRAPRREGRGHRAERPRQVDAAQDRHRTTSTPTPATVELGARGARRLLRAGSPRGARRTTR